MRRRTIKVPTRTGSLTLGDARATALAVGSVRGTRKRKPNAAFMKAMTPSGPLAAVVGRSAMSRSEVTKKIWGYIQQNGLLDKKTGRMVNADRKLRPVFGGRAHIETADVPKLVNRHLK